MIAESHERARDLARNPVRWFGPKRGLAWIDDRCLWSGIAPATYRVEREFYAWVRRYVREEIKRLDAADSHLGRTPVGTSRRTRDVVRGPPAPQQAVISLRADGGQPSRLVLVRGVAAALGRHFWFDARGPCPGSSLRPAGGPPFRGGGSLVYTRWPVIFPRCRLNRGSSRSGS